MTTVLITIEGGNVQEVLTDDLSVEIHLIDYDNHLGAETPEHFGLLKPAGIVDADDES